MTMVRAYSGGKLIYGPSGVTLWVDSPYASSGDAAGEAGLSILSQAIREARASAPVGVVEYHTLEIRHASLTDPIRLVRDYTDLDAALEADAPVGAGELVTFVRYAFDLVEPEISADGVPQMTITIDNVSRYIVAAMEAAVLTTDPVRVTYRNYLSSDLSGPQNEPPIHMTVLSVSCDLFLVRAVCGFPNLIDRKFPTLEYTAEEFPGLVS